MRENYTYMYVLSNKLRTVCHNLPRSDEYYLPVFLAGEPDTEPAALIDSGKLLDGTFSSPRLTDSPFTSGSQSTNILDISFTKTSCSSVADTTEEGSQEYQRGK